MYSCLNKYNSQKKDNPQNLRSLYRLKVITKYLKCKTKYKCIYCGFCYFNLTTYRIST